MDYLCPTWLKLKITRESLNLLKIRRLERWLQILRLHAKIKQVEQGLDFIILTDSDSNLQLLIRVKKLSRLAWTKLKFGCVNVTTRKTEDGFEAWPRLSGLDGSSHHYSYDLPYERQVTMTNLGDAEMTRHTGFVLDVQSGHLQLVFPGWLANYHWSQAASDLNNYRLL